MLSDLAEFPLGRITVRLAQMCAYLSPEGVSLRLLRSPDFTWQAEQADDWRKPWPEFIRTRYEAKAVREGRTPCYLIFRHN